MPVSTSTYAHLFLSISDYAYYPSPESGLYDVITDVVEADDGHVVTEKVVWVPQMNGCCVLCTLVQHLKVSSFI